MSGRELEVELDKKLRARTTAFNLLVAAVVFLVLAGFLTLGLQIRSTNQAIRDTQQTGSPLLLRVDAGVRAAAAAADDAARAARLAKISQEQLADCVEPTGQCFKEGQDRTGQIVTGFGNLTIAAAFCSVQYGADEVLTDDEFREFARCVRGYAAPRARGSL